MKRYGWLLFWAVALALVVWALSNVSLAATIALIRALSPLSLLFWLLMNVVVVVTMTGRWYYVLEGMGHKLPLLTLTKYRLAAFGVSYFTPGPQFGGEYFLVFPIQQRHQVPTTTGIAAVTIEKALELLVNFAFLATGLLIVLLGQGERGRLTYALLPFVLALLALPISFLWLYWTGKRPVSTFLDYLQNNVRRINIGERLERIAEIETGITTFCRHSPRSVSLALIGSFVNWSLMLFEYWFLYTILGTTLDAVMLATAYTAARLAFLVPTPGALGVLESSQIAATTLMGLDPAIGLSTALLIRARDISIGLIGLFIARKLSKGPKSTAVAP